SAASESAASEGYKRQGYGAQICFSDGHDKGIFPWAFLKEFAKS
ncbi:gamma-butyrobetaine hydroxylase-like domain-containing protein, partial [Acinetobacter baumannii]